MKETLDVINRMQADGIIGTYAIGGAVGATFYLEPVATLDLDVFVSFRQLADSPLFSLSPIFDYLKKLGHETRGEYVVIGGWPVQFLPPADALGEEALALAVETEVEGVPTRVMTAEHSPPSPCRSAAPRTMSASCNSWNPACLTPTDSTRSSSGMACLRNGKASG